MPEDSEFRNNDPLLVRIAEAAKKHRARLKRTFAPRIRKKASNIEIAQAFLRRVGLELKYLRRERAKEPQGTRQRVYGYPQPYIPRISQS